MAPRKDRYTDGEEEMAKAAWDVLMDLESDAGGPVLLAFHTAEQRGVFCFHASATGIDATGEVGVFASEALRWPNSTEMSLAAHLYRLASNLARMAGERVQRERAERARVAAGK